MYVASFDALVTGLAANRASDVFSDVRIDGLRSKADAVAVQTAALEAYTDDFCGYAMVGTSASSRQAIGLRSPIYTPLPDRAHFADGWRIHLPQGMIGAQCEMAFTLGRAFPERGEIIDRRSASDAILACRSTIGLLGRRARPGPDCELAAIADFALHVATICGPVAENADLNNLDRSAMTARIDGKVVVTAEASAILGHPIEAVVWLARELSRQDKPLNAGDVVTTGSCAPLLQVLPGQHLTVEFDTIGSVSCWFD